MTNYTNTGYDQQESAETNADRTIETIRDGLMHDAIDADDLNEGLWLAAVTTELDSRLDKRVTSFPSRFDPRDEFDGNSYEVAVDEYLGEITDAIAREAHELDDPEGRESLLEMVAELDTRIGGGT